MTHNDLMDFLNRYQCGYHIDYDRLDTYPTIVGKCTLTLTFYSQQNFAYLIDDLKSQEEEKILRKKNPALQKAYEEYQILLKLMK